jgi:hypothetical protein
MYDMTAHFDVQLSQYEIDDVINSLYTKTFSVFDDEGTPNNNFDDRPSAYFEYPGEPYFLKVWHNIINMHNVVPADEDDINDALAGKHGNIICIPDWPEGYYWLIIEDGKVTKGYWELT